MANKTKRIILDTNLWISFLLTHNYTKIDKLLSSNNIKLLFSEELLNEFLEVAARPKFKKYFTVTDLEDLVTTIHEHALFVKVKSNVTICSDPKDDFLLALAKDGKADYLITGDNALLALHKYRNTNIVSINKFFEEM